MACSDDHAAEQVIRHLVGQGYVVESLVEQEAVGRLATARLHAPDEGASGVVLDLLFASSGIEMEIVRDAESLELFPGQVVRVARHSHLIASKLLARDDETRPQDAADLRALLFHSPPQELEQVPRLLSLIEERGYSRGRDLEQAWAQASEGLGRQGG